MLFTFYHMVLFQVITRRRIPSSHQEEMGWKEGPTCHLSVARQTLITHIPSPSRGECAARIPPAPPGTTRGLLSEVMGEGRGGGRGCTIHPRTWKDVQRWTCCQSASLKEEPTDPSSHAPGAGISSRTRESGCRARQRVCKRREHGLRPPSHLRSPASHPQEPRTLRRRDRGRRLCSRRCRLSARWPRSWESRFSNPDQNSFCPLDAPPHPHPSSLFPPCLQDAGTRSQGPVQLRLLRTPHHPHPTSHHSPARLASQMVLMCSPASSHPFLVPLQACPSPVQQHLPPTYLSILLPACLLGLLCHLPPTAGPEVRIIHIGSGFPLAYRWVRSQCKLAHLPYKTVPILYFPPF